MMLFVVTFVAIERTIPFGLDRPKVSVRFPAATGSSVCVRRRHQIAGHERAYTPSSENANPGVSCFLIQAAATYSVLCLHLCSAGDMHLLSGKGAIPVRRLVIR
jgi:hypothetical protein